MKASELRINNLLQDSSTGSLLIVSALSNNTIISSVLDRDKYPLPNGWKAEPIQLTEEWLIRFGFEDQSKALKTPDKTLNVSAIVDGYYYMYLDDVFGFVFDLERIQYVHQLQNLYFALTGEELKLKTDK